VKAIALILVSLLTGWWCILTAWVVSCHRERVRAAAKPMTPEELDECRRLEASFPRYHMRLRDWASFGLVFQVFNGVPLEHGAE
jgi:hypothetical protein